MGVSDLSYSCDNVVCLCTGGYVRPADVTGCVKVTCLGAKGLSEDKALPDSYNSSEWTWLQE